MTEGGSYDLADETEFWRLRHLGNNVQGHFVSPTKREVSAKPSSTVSYCGYNVTRQHACIGEAPLLASLLQRERPVHADKEDGYQRLRVKSFSDLFRGVYPRLGDLV